MPAHSSRTVAFAVAAIVLLMSAGAALQRLRDQTYPPSAFGEDVLYVTSGTTLKRLTVGYHALAADVYWIRTIQYFGGIRRRLLEAPAGATRDATPEAAFPLLYPFLDLTTTLDPLFNIAYRFGAIFLTEPFPSGAGRPDLAVALLEKGLAARPDKWEYMQDIGYVHYWWLQDYGAAARWFDRAAQVPGAPWFLKSLAAVTLAEGGSRQSSRVMWESIRESAEIAWLRNDAERRLRQLDALDAIETLQRIVDRAARQLGYSPANWPQVVQAGLIRGVPVDPEGLPFEIAQGGRVGLSPQSSLAPLPVEPKRLGMPALP